MRILVRTGVMIAALAVPLSMMTATAAVSSTMTAPPTTDSCRAWASPPECWPAEN